MVYKAYFTLPPPNPFAFVITCNTLSGGSMFRDTFKKIEKLNDIKMRYFFP